MKKAKKQQFNHRPRLAYMGFLFQAFLKRPFGYIIGVLYVVYLAVILLIVPAAIKQPPLFIWNSSAFKMPIFNLFFIGAATASMAVAIFRIGREDGTDLTVSAKPLTKNDTVWIKTLVYVIIMLIFVIMSLFLVSLIKPVFGTYDPIQNPIGVEQSKYIGILLSVFVGNLVNMLLFGGVAVLISMVGGQVITMIGTIGLAFLMCLMNFIYPRVIVSPIDVVTDTLNTSISSYKLHTLNEYEQQSDISIPLTYCAIQCHNEEDDTNIDTKKGWDQANELSGSNVINYIDFGKQLASLYQAFGLEELQLEDAKQLFIGASVEYRYEVDGSTGVKDETNVNLNKYPIACYSMSTNQGQIYPIVYMLGGDVSTISLDNWYLRSKIIQVDFNATSIASSVPDGYSAVRSEDKEKFGGKPWRTMNEMYLSDAQKSVASQWFSDFINQDEPKNDQGFRDWMHDQIFNSSSSRYQVAKTNFFPDSEWDELSINQKYDIVTKIHLYWAILAQKMQIKMIEDYWKNNIVEHEFPFVSTDVTEWSLDRDDESIRICKDIERIFNHAISIDTVPDSEGEEHWYFSKLIHSTLDYPETYNNLYTYDVVPCYSLYGLILGWSIISIAFFASSIIVYKKTDFK